MFLTLSSLNELNRLNKINSQLRQKVSELHKTNALLQKQLASLRKELKERRTREESLLALLKASAGEEMCGIESKGESEVWDWETFWEFDGGDEVLANVRS
ncbi:hypothetical protein K440DRAFT_632449 [Wilcoxina mikolae CBS 423.85]|nr:hypothetical protein K440DRAFT_632449 [Wilcoxina mikolae CBS 423.85]